MGCACSTPSAGPWSRTGGWPRSSTSSATLPAPGRRRGPFAIHFIDLDEFKQVNDTLGHPCGDELLCAVAERLRNAVRSSDVVARFGGDEFVILQYPLGHPKEAAVLAERLVAELTAPFQISGHEVVVGASVGIALAPRDGSNADLLLKNADM